MDPVQIITATSAVVVAATALCGALVALFREVHLVHVTFNSRMDEMLALAKKASFAEGQLAGPPVLPSPPPVAVTP